MRSPPHIRMNKVDRRTGREWKHISTTAKETHDLLT